MKHWCYSLMLGIGMTLSWTGVSANSSATPLDLDQALARVLEHNPQLRAAAHDFQAAEARLRQAQLTSPYHVSLELENLNGNDQDNSQTTLSLSKQLETGGKTALRGEVARQELQLLAGRQHAEYLELRAETARRFYSVAGAQARLALADHAVQLTTRIRQIVTRQVAGGAAAHSERLRADIAVARAELDLEHAEHKLASARLQLAALWGAEQAEFGLLQVELFELEPLPELNALRAALEQHPQLNSFNTRSQLAETNMRLAQARRRPDIELSAGVRHRRDDDDQALVLSASIPLGNSWRAEPFIEQARQQQLREPLLHVNQRLEMQALLFSLYQELGHTATAVDILQRRIIPQAQGILDDYERGYRGGRYSLVELINAQQGLLQARQEAIQTATEYHYYRIDIQRLTGAVSTQGANP